VGNDSTINGQALTIFGTTTVPGKIGDSLDFPGTVNDYLIRNPFSGFPLTEITCEYWIQSFTTGEGMISYASTITDNDFLLFDQDVFTIFIKNVFVDAGIDVSTGAFNHIIVTWRSSDGQLLVYLNGTQVFSTILRQGESITDGGSLVLGQEQDNIGGGFSPTQALDGTLDEVRISNNVRSADYTTTSFNNQSDPIAFYTVGAVETIPDISSFGIMGYEA